MRLGLAIAFLVSIAPARAEPTCNDPAVIDAFLETIKCQELLRCATDEIVRGTSKELSKLSDEELRQRALTSMNAGTPAQTKAAAWSRGFTELAAATAAESHIGWRNAFSSMKANATPIDYDPSRKRYVCQGYFTFDKTLLTEALIRYSRLAALSNETVIKAITFKLSENQDPNPILRSAAISMQLKLQRCLNENRTFYVQPTTGNAFIVGLDQNALVPGCPD